MTSTAASPPPSESHRLGYFLRAQRESVLAIIAGLNEDQLRTPVLSSGWTVIGMIKHLTDAERSWISAIMLGRSETDDEPEDVPGSGELEQPGDPHPPFATADSTDAVLDQYRIQARATDELISSTALDTAPQRPEWAEWPEEDITDLRWIVLHLIEETARHAGHLDAARELIDGATGLGPR